MSERGFSEYDCTVRGCWQLGISYHRTFNLIYELPVGLITSMCTSHVVQSQIQLPVEVSIGQCALSIVIENWVAMRQMWHPLAVNTTTNGWNTSKFPILTKPCSIPRPLLWIFVQRVCFLYTCWYLLLYLSSTMDYHNYFLKIFWWWCLSPEIII